MASGSGWNVWVRLVDVVVRSYIDFLILLIPTPLVYTFLFCSSIPTFCSLKKIFFVLVPVLFGNKIMYNFFSAQYKHTYGRLRTSHGSYMKGCNYTRRSTHKRTLRWMYTFKGRGVELKVEGVHYIEMHRGPHTC